MTGVQRGARNYSKCNWEYEKSRENERGWGTRLLGLLQCTVWHLKKGSRFARVYFWPLELFTKEDQPIRERVTTSSGI